MDAPDPADESDAPSDSGEEESNDPSDGTPEPTPQSAALRRQQAYVGTGGALVAGGALTVVVFQQYTDNPVLALLAGLAGSAAVLWLVRRSIFPGETAGE